MMQAWNIDQTAIIMVTAVIIRDMVTITAMGDTIQVMGTTTVMAAIIRVMVIIMGMAHIILDMVTITVMVAIILGMGTITATAAIIPVMGTIMVTEVINKGLSEHPQFEHISDAKNGIAFLIQNKTNGRIVITSKVE